MKRQRRDSSPTFFGGQGSDDYVILYYLNTKTYSDPIYIANPCFQMDMSERLLLQKRDFLKVKVEGQIMSALVIERGPISTIMRSSQELESNIDEDSSIADDFPLVVSCSIKPESALTFDCQELAENTPQTSQSDGLVSADVASTPMLKEIVARVGPQIEPKVGRILERLLHEQKSSNALLRRICNLQEKMVAQNNGVKRRSKRIITSKCIEDYNGEMIDIDTIHAMDERAMAWKLLTFMLKEDEIEGRMMEPLKSTDQSKVINPAVVKRLKQTLNDIYEDDYDWESIRKSVNQRIRDKAYRKYQKSAQSKDAKVDS